ncbi:MAG: nucleotidyl transferase AbiEii/AbiGii toxin family protein [Candidatus Sungiibacteriota bacterium]
MISPESTKQLATRYRTSESNVIREYFQHVFLAELYKLPGAGKLLFKGGTALRIVYGSPRFSEDLDFSLFGIYAHEQKKYVEDLFNAVLATIERGGIHVIIDGKSDATSGGYWGAATFHLYDHPSIAVAINISSRNGREVREEVETIANDFIPTYNLLHLPKEELVDEKVFGALLERKKERDFYDLYFMLRKGMLSSGQKYRLAGVKEQILASAGEKDFRSELGVFLPADLQPIIGDFQRALRDELNRQTSEVI